jgi:hypothetical protein
MEKLRESPLLLHRGQQELMMMMNTSTKKTLVCMSNEVNETI